MSEQSKKPAVLSRDPYGELNARRRLPAGLKRRFPDRVLVMTTDRCFSYCPHCTRKWILGKTPLADSPARLRAIVAYVRKHPEIRDVLLSGGDVLTLDDAQVGGLVRTFAELEQIAIVRICTRAPVVKPARLTSRLARLLARSRKVWMNVHINTAAEADVAARALAPFIDRGIPVSSQTVLLKGVNDTPGKMLELLRHLSAGRIRPYYVFQCDPVAGLDEFRVDHKRALAIERHCAERIGGLALPRFVADLPGAKRKLPLETLDL